MPLLLTVLLLTFPVGSSPSPAPTPTAESSVQTLNAPAEPPEDSVYTIATTRYTYEWISEIQSWQNRQLSLETFFPFGTFVIDMSQQRRFGRNEIGGRTDFWVGLWGESYGHIHTSIAPNALTMPRFTVGGELYEVRGKWEFSGWFEWRRYPQTPVLVLGPQIARYFVGWYVRLRTSIVNRRSKWVAMEIAAVRHYLGSPDSFVEGQVGFGRSVELVDASVQGQLEVTRSYFASARIRHFFSQHLGGSLSAKYSNEVYRRTGVSLGLLVRW